MTRFRYRAVDDTGQPVDGTMEETSAHRVTSVLRERGLTVNSVTPLEQPRGLVRVSKRLTWEEVQVFTEQLTAVTKSNLPLAPAIRAMAADLRSPRLKPLFEELHRSLDRGDTLEEALERNAESFPPLYPSLVRAGEQAGNLPGVLQMLCGYSERMVALKHNMQIALAYPVVLCLVSVLIVAFLLVKVVPVFADIFQEFGGRLPWPTQFLLSMSDLVQHQWPGLMTAFALLGVLLKVGPKLLGASLEGRRVLEALRLRMPILGRLDYLLSVARFARTLALLLASRVPVLESMELAAAASGSASVQYAVSEATLQVASGERLADALAFTGFFAHNFCWLLSMGEDRGEADIALNSIADMYERETSMRDQLLSTFITPTLILFIGGFIGFVILALYLPIFTLGDSIGS